MGRSRATMPTEEQRRLIASRGLVASCWLVIGDSERELRLVHRFSGSTWKIKKKIAPRTLASAGAIKKGIRKYLAFIIADLEEIVNEK